jgi:CP family cyanate transporter-like MFS transporter
MADSRPHPRRADPAAAGAGVLLLAVGITAACLRSPVTAVGAELGSLRAAPALGGLGLGGLGAGVLTAMPLAVFAAAGLAAPAVVRRVGSRAVVLGGPAVIAVGLLARAAAGSVTALLAASTVVLVAVAWINVVLPPLVAPRSPWATGVFSGGVLVGIAAPAALAVPIGTATGLGWRGGLGVWALLAVAALACAAVAGPSLAAPSPTDPSSVSEAVTRPITVADGHRPVALAVFFGAQSLGAFAVMGWLPQVYRDAGIAPGTASMLLAVTVVPALPAALLLPSAVRRGHGTALVAGVGAAQVLGLAGLALAPAGGAWLWAALLTTAHWGFPLAMALIARRAAGDATRLSAQVQGTGYALAVAGPLLLGPLHDITGAWTVPLALLLAAAIVQVAAGLRVTLTAPVVGTRPAPTDAFAPTLPIRIPENRS